MEAHSRLLQMFLLAYAWHWSLLNLQRSTSFEKLSFDMSCRSKGNLLKEKRANGTKRSYRLANSTASPGVHHLVSFSWFVVLRSFCGISDIRKDRFDFSRTWGGLQRLRQVGMQSRTLAVTQHKLIKFRVKELLKFMESRTWLDVLTSHGQVDFINGYAHVTITSDHPGNFSSSSCSSGCGSVSGSEVETSDERPSLNFKFWLLQSQRNQKTRGKTNIKTRLLLEKPCFKQSTLICVYVCVLGVCVQTWSQFPSESQKCINVLM